MADEDADGAAGADGPDGEEDEDPRHRVEPRDAETLSEIPVDLVYGPDDAPQAGVPKDAKAAKAHLDRVGFPGEPPFTRGPYPSMYRGRLWTMRQYAGFGTAEETNERYRYLLEQGQTGLSVAFDLPTQMGYDSDHPLASGEVGKVGVAIDHLGDMRRLFDGIPLADVSTSMTINATASTLLMLYRAVGEAQGADPAALRGTVQNDVLKEFETRNTYIYPPQPSMRLVTDVFAYCAEEMPRWNTISISGYHIREAGATAVQELAFTFANAKAYVEAAVERGLDIDAFAPRLSFFFCAQSDVLEEVAKFRAARRMWHRIMDDLGAEDDESKRLRFHTQTAGVSLTAQEPMNNVVRVTYQALAAVLGGTQSLHTNALDEALGLPTEKTARIALRTQQVLAEETGAANTIDPFAGSYHLEALTDELEERAFALMDRIDEMGGAVAAVERGFIQREIHESAYRLQQRIEAGERTVVGVNAYRSEDTESQAVDVHEVPEALEAGQVERLEAHRRSRDGDAVEQALSALKGAAEQDPAEAGEEAANTCPRILSAVEAGATVGEVSDAMREVFGEHAPRDA